MGLFNWGKAVDDAGSGVQKAFSGIGDGIGNIINSAKGQIPPEYQGKIELLEVEIKGKLLEAEITTKVQVKELLAKAQDSLRNFTLQYEGTAAQVPKWILVLRSIIRPFITIIMFSSFMFFLFSDILNKGVEGYIPWMKDLPAEYWWILGVVVVFWFGGKAVENSIDKLKK